MIRARGRRLVQLAACAVIACGTVRSGHAQPAPPAERAQAAADPAAIVELIGAAHQGRRDLVERHVAAGIDVNARHPGGIRTTALLEAIARLHPELAMYLLEHGADPNLANADGVGPLALALRASLHQGWRPGYRALIDALLARGANLDARDRTGVTPLMEAITIGNGDAVALLLGKGAKLDDRTADGRTPLHLASRSAPRLAAALLELGADPRAVDAAGRTPLMEAVAHGWLDAVTPALMDYFPEYIAMLVARGVAVDAVDRSGLTALAEAARNGDLGTARLLLAHGARPTPRAFELAVAYRHGELAEALIEAGAPLAPAQRFKHGTSTFAMWLARLFPILILGAIVGLWLLSRRVLRRPVPPRHDAAHGDALPRLAPLACTTCGAGVPLALAEMACPACKAPARPPEDYVATLQARSAAATALQQAVGGWRRARRSSSTPVRGALLVIGFGWLAITNVGVFNEIGRSVFTGHGVLLVMAMLGGVGMPLMLVAYVSYLRDVHVALPVIPAIGAHVASPEAAACPTCGGAIAYEAGQLVTSCGYCGTETYRVELARRSRVAARAEHAQAALSLHDAMVAVDERRRQLFDHLLMAPLALPVLLTVAPVGTVLVLGVLALVGSL